MLLSRFRGSYTSMPLRQPKTHACADTRKSDLAERGSRSSKPRNFGTVKGGGLAGAAGRAWSYVTNEAAALDEEAPPASVPRPSVHICVNLQLRGRPF